MSLREVSCGFVDRLVGHHNNTIHESTLNITNSSLPSIKDLVERTRSCWFVSRKELKRRMKNQRAVIRIVVAGLLLMHATTTVRSVQTPLTKPEAADQPSPRTDRNSMLAHADLLEKAKQGRIDVYFEGDSITRRWGTSDEPYKHFLRNWQQNFFGWNAADFGWGGDKTQNILWRLNNGELDNVKPKIIVLLAGTNNLGNNSPPGKDDPRVADITRGIKAILDVCRRKAPGATIVLMGITPRNDNILVMPIINEINRRIAKFADGKKIRYLNINDKLADKHGRLFVGMTNKDGLHLDVKGYQVWADALKPIFTQLLGPPAKDDHAPPPTEDPSQKNRATSPS
jgi:lysophospholipase L1-like esterase